MGEEQGLSAENRALVEREIDPINLRIMDALYSWSLVNHLMDAARSEGLQPPVVEVEEEVFSSLGASRAPSCVSAGVAETPSEGAVSEATDAICAMFSELMRTPVVLARLDHSDRPLDLAVAWLDRYAPHRMTTKRWPEPDCQTSGGGE